MAKSKLRELSTDFAVKVIRHCETIKGHYSLVNQLERSATSIGANIREANYAHGKADLIAKLQIALKECFETEYWLESFVKSQILDRETTADLYTQCGTIRRILIASINTAKRIWNDHLPLTKSGSALPGQSRSFRCYLTYSTTTRRLGSVPVE